MDKTVEAIRILSKHAGVWPDGGLWIVVSARVGDIPDDDQARLRELGFHDWRQGQHEYYAHAYQLREGEDR